MIISTGKNYKFKKYSALRNQIITVTVTLIKLIKRPGNRTLVIYLLNNKEHKIPLSVFKIRTSQFEQIIK